MGSNMLNISNFSMFDPLEGEQIKQMKYRPAECGENGDGDW